MNNNAPYDLEKLNPDKLRLKKRRILLKRFFVATIIIAVISLKLMSLTILTGGAISSLKANKPGQALQRLFPLNIFNIIETYKLYFNKGNALFIKGDYPSAESNYREAQKSAPEEFLCQITFNLILSIEAQADKAVEDKDFDKAVDRYEEIIAIVKNTKCGFTTSEKAAEEKMKKSAKESKEKSDKAKQDRNGEKEKVKPNEQKEGNDPTPTEEQEKKLEESNENSRQKRQQREQDRTFNDRKYDAKNW